MKITVDIKENEILDAANEMIAAADDLGKKAWRLKNLILKGEENPLPKDESRGSESTDSEQSIGRSTEQIKKWFS